MQSSSQSVVGGQRSIHQILGGGFVADVILWEQRDVTVGILLGTLASWVVFELSGYTLLSLVSNVLLLLISILFLWAKAAGVLNRPPPPVPDLYVPEEYINDVVTFLHYYINLVLSAFYDIAHGKDMKLFFRVALWLWLIEFIGGWIDLLTLIYAGIVIILTIPALYQKYEECFDQYLKLAYRDLIMHERVYIYVFNKYHKQMSEWLIEKKKFL